MDTEIQQQFRRIVDVITCADGGAEFHKLRLLIDKLEQEDSETSRKALEVSVTRFYRLIELAN